MRRNNQKERIFIRYIYSIHINKVSFRGLPKLWQHPDWSLLEVKFEISDEHPVPSIWEPPTPHRGKKMVQTHQSIGLDTVTFVKNSKVFVGREGGFGRGNVGRGGESIGRGVHVCL